MLNAFKKYFIGGASGSREGIWFLLLVFGVVPFFYVMIKEASGVEMKLTVDLLRVIIPSLMIPWTAIHVHQKAVDNGVYKNGPN